MKSSDLAQERTYSDEENEIQLQDILTNLPVVKGEGIHPDDFKTWKPPGNWKFTRVVRKAGAAEAPAELKPRRAIGARPGDDRR